MVRIALVCSVKTQRIGENTSLRDALADLGHDVTIVCFDETPLPAWSDLFDVVFIRTIWGYESFLHDEYLALIDSLTRSGVSVLNTLDTITWNADKAGYLTDLAEAGVPCVPTAVITGEDRKGKSASTIESLIRERLSLCGFDPARASAEFVVKPSLGADGIGVTVHPNLPHAASHLAANLTSPTTHLVQPLATSVRTAGEVSVVVALRHCGPIRCIGDVDVLGRFVKHPLQDDGANDSDVSTSERGSVMVQERLGGSTALSNAGDPNGDERGLAAGEAEVVVKAIGAVNGGGPVLARVDMLGMADQGMGDGPRLSELELIEPSIYGDLDPGVVRGLARALHERIAAMGRE